MRRTIEINDDLRERSENVRQEVKERYNEWRADNAGASFSSFDGYDVVHEAADSNTPIYTYDIDGLYYLYGAEMDAAYEAAGFGDGKEDNYKQVAIFCYLYEIGNETLSEIEKELDEQGK